MPEEPLRSSTKVGQEGAMDPPTPHGFAPQTPHWDGSHPSPLLQQDRAGLWLVPNFRSRTNTQECHPWMLPGGFQPWKQPSRLWDMEIHGNPLDLTQGGVTWRTQPALLQACLPPGLQSSWRAQIQQHPFRMFLRELVPVGPGLWTLFQGSRAGKVGYPTEPLRHSKTNLPLLCHSRRANVGTPKPSWTCLPLTCRTHLGHHGAAHGRLLLGWGEPGGLRGSLWGRAGQEATAGLRGWGLAASLRGT